jgi:hypothetical protein
MSLISSPASQTPAQSRAIRALRLHRAIFVRLMRSWTGGVEAVWAAASPADVLAAMGGQAGEYLTRLGQWQAALEAQQPGCTAVAAARARPYSVNADGTVIVKAAA